MNIITNAAGIIDNAENISVTTQSNMVTPLIRTPEDNGRIINYKRKNPYNRCCCRNKHYGNF